jgi:hypothetical protein
MERRMLGPALVVVTGLLSLWITNASADLPEVGDVVGIRTVDGSGWLAVRVEIPEDYAETGMMSYNNDETQVFPQILVGTGHVEGPGTIADMVPVATAVAGASLEWSEVVFDQPVAASLGALYVVFEFPAGSQFEEPGPEGGAAVGYTEGDGGTRGWISGDGESWLSLSEEYTFALLPTLVPYEPGMLVKSFGEGDDEAAQDAVAELYLRSGPNPFNPSIRFEFGLPKSDRVCIDVFDIRGARTVRLVDRVFSAGRHHVTWQGRDESGRQAASGVYFVRMQAGLKMLTERVTLVK